MSDVVGTVLDRHMAGEPVGITSVCSAHPRVLGALGLTPDTPSPDGQVNRVVKGVTVHPLEADR